MWSSIVAAVSVLAGVALGHVLQALNARRVRRDAVASLVGDLLREILAYREAHWHLVERIRAGGEETEGDVERRFSLRSAVTNARDRVYLAATSEDLRRAASKASWDAVVLSDVKVGRAVDGRFADDVEAQLAELRERSRTAHDELLEAGVRHAHGRRISGR